MKFNYHIKSIISIGFLLIADFVFSQNPIVPNVGLNDPHIHIFKDTAYVYASHDKSIENNGFVMEDWWIWSSPDLVNWTKRSVLKPEDTYIGKDFTGCWATDVGYKNGKYYWYFSERNEQTGVVVGDTPVGPWRDPLSKPILTSELTPTHEYDMAIFEDEGEHFIIFGVWDYYIAKLNDDMISLAESPKKISITNPRGPYNSDGKNKEMPTDDKPFVHKYKGKYYLSWGCFYAMSDNLYGPYDYVDTIIKESSFAEGFDDPTWPNGFLQGRHGSFFEWHNQWYFAYCDISQTGNRWFRDTFISYVHYKDDGTIAPIRVDGTGVGQYNANNDIEAEDYFKADGLHKTENTVGGFSMESIKDEGYAVYPNIQNLNGKKGIEFEILSSSTNEIEVHEGSPTGKLLATCKFQANNTRAFKKESFETIGLYNGQTLCLVFKPVPNGELKVNRFRFK
ncbi:family 43 glycosylhydrolase [Namhaeicola litoreus]|uniref:Family 43 glycosylhydrolase n=1 Tax=Namhaeicola litoreus TaxID=1052145 RepID=A0ABW3Y3D7_9FLAO